MSHMLDLYEFKMSLFYNVKLEEFLLFFHNFNVTPVASRNLLRRSEERRVGYGTIP